ncbi:helix-turn-helix transcriptional regulator [Prauserella cavernicola]|uniref:DNA-binding protein n=1 Tax=Prauserella cavernicola TaxID=2800127 RepID=A0A934QV14_9PSEU|nr:hypothetical protein [Prauserella cavernicola]MBK1787086.1 hypothetical protein [Prauserella cavernicola]
MVEGVDGISDALEGLALALGESGAVPAGELVRALERAADRLRRRGEPMVAPSDLVTQAEASRTIGVSRQAVNQWVRKGTLRTYATGDRLGHGGSRVSLSEVAVVANRRSPVRFSLTRRGELLDFLDLVADPSAKALARDLREVFEGGQGECGYTQESRVLGEFVIAAMETGDRQREFTADGVRLLADLRPKFEVDPATSFGQLARSLDVLVTSSSGVTGFDSPVTVILGLLAVATVGARYSGADTDLGRDVARSAEEVWGEDWPARLYDAAYHGGELKPPPLVRYTASLTYLDNNRFLRQAQSAGVTISYARGPGAVLPQRFYGAPLHDDVLRGRSPGPEVWAFTEEAAAAIGRPSRNPSAVSPFRVFNYEYGLMDTSIHGIRRYCFSAADARAEFRATLGLLTSTQRRAYIEMAIGTLAKTVGLPHVELVAVDGQEDFDWWKDHIIRSSEREVLIGLRDDEARKVSHALLVQTDMLSTVVEAADSDSSLRDRLRIYVKNLEFDVIEARYQDDLRRGTARLLKAGGVSLTPDESRALAEAEIDSYLT